MKEKWGRTVWGRSSRRSLKWAEKFQRGEGELGGSKIEDV